MNRAKKSEAPKWPGRIIEWYCGERMAEDLIGDIQELYFKNVIAMPRLKARFKYSIQAMSLAYSAADFLYQLIVYNIWHSGSTGFSYKAHRLRQIEQEVRGDFPPERVLKHIQDD